MNRTSGHRLLRASLFAALLVSPLAHADQWIVPSKEELSMTSQVQVPGAAAVYLNREETSEDDLHMFGVYVRLKVLSESGKDQANIEIQYGNQGSGGFNVDSIEGRTIHSDGTIIPFTGKPYEKLIEKTRGAKYMAKVFSMPDVQVGSILEYRYKIRYSDYSYWAPSWFIQSKLFTRKAHYLWKPTNLRLSNDRGSINTISWLPILPAGAEVKKTEMAGSTINGNQRSFEVSVNDVPPAPEEEFMPPIGSFTYRVLFYYSTYRMGDDFWKNEGKVWSKSRDKFIGPGRSVVAAVHDLTLPADTQDQKLRKLYAAVMNLENTDFTRQHTSAEEKAQGLKEVRTTDDIWDHKRGSSDEIAQLFVAMARASGMKAYLLAVTNRDRSIFLRPYPSLGQLDDYLAIVNVDGKEQIFDPGSRFCPYQHLAWKHSMAGGLRQIDGGTDIAVTPSTSYKESHLQRVAMLTMDEHGMATGTIKLTYMGAPALRLRQHSLTGDATSLEREVRESTEQLLPHGMEIKVSSIKHLADYEQPLVIDLLVNGELGSSTGKRILLPGDVFQANSKATFTQEKREIPVYFDFPFMDQDAVRITFPASLKVESLPANDATQFQTFAVYDMTSESTPTSVTIRRNYSLGEIIFMPKEYADLRSFYSKIEAKDQESVVLTASKPNANGN